MVIKHSREFSDRLLFGNLRQFGNCRIARDRSYGDVTRSPKIYSRKVGTNQQFSIDKAIKLNDFIKQLHSQVNKKTSSRKNDENISKSKKASKF